MTQTFLLVAGSGRRIAVFQPRSLPSCTGPYPSPSPTPSSVGSPPIPPTPKLQPPPRMALTRPFLTSVHHILYPEPPYRCSLILPLITVTPMLAALMQSSSFIFPGDPNPHPYTGACALLLPCILCSWPFLTAQHWPIEEPCASPMSYKRTRLVLHDEYTKGTVYSGHNTSHPMSGISCTLN